MNITSIESIPQAWIDQNDVPFFSIVARLFSTTFTYGAGVLLATNSDADADVSGAQLSPATATLAGHPVVNIGSWMAASAEPANRVRTAE